ncbi:histidine phosphatase family protein [Pseudomonas oryzihabitans]|nr:hypothetical protein [Pseudomonas oryzihabitans]
MKIILMRHGKPALENGRALFARDMTHWIASYDLAEIGEEMATSQAIAAVRDIGLAATSTAPRALTSLAALDLAPTIKDAVFCEAALPVVRVPLLRLSPFAWAFVFRLLWLCGLAKDTESYAQARQRSRQAADTLAALAERNGENVLLLGHGFMNRLIAKHLRRQGWAEGANSGSGYWSFAV